jgi:metal-dependent amidase/aminoacylase/carboxypeptidase family protein
MTTACGHGVSSTFSTSRPSEEALELLKRGFEDMGFQVSEVDRQEGQVKTRWHDTGRIAPGLMPGQVPGTVFVRYTATWIRASSGRYRVQISGEAQRCTDGAYVMASSEVTGACDGVIGPASDRQEATDALAEHLTRALSAPDEERQASASAATPVVRARPRRGQR